MKTDFIEDLSFSGISNIIADADVPTVMEFLHQLDYKYNQVKQKQLTLEKELDNLKFERGCCVTGFLHAHKILIGTSEKPLSFINSEEDFVNIKRLEDNKMDYEVYPLTIKNDLFLF